MELYAMLAVFLENPFLWLISIGGCTIQFLLRITTIHHGKSGNHTDQPVFLGTMLRVLNTFASLGTGHLSNNNPQQPFVIDDCHT